MGGGPLSISAESESCGGGSCEGLLAPVQGIDRLPQVLSGRPGLFCTQARDSSLHRSPQPSPWALFWLDWFFSAGKVLCIKTTVVVHFVGVSHDARLGNFTFCGVFHARPPCRAGAGLVSSSPEASSSSSSFTMTGLLILFPGLG